MIRSSKHYLNYQNDIKTTYLDRIFVDYQTDLEYYINLIIKDKLPLKELLSSKDLPTNIIQHSIWKQIIYKNASEIIRSDMDRTKDRTFKYYQKLYKKCIEKGKYKFFTNKKFSELNINYVKRIEIEIKEVSINLCYNLFDIKKGNHFDEFVRVRTPYFPENKKWATSINFPLKHHRHSLKFRNWDRNNTIQLKKINNKYFINLFYNRPDPEIKSSGTHLGIDLGFKKLIATSDEKYFGVGLEKIYIDITNKVRGSKNYKQSLIHRTNETNRSVNEFINSYDLNYLVMEDLKNLRYKSKFHHKELNKQQYYIYSHVIKKMERVCQERGIYLEKVSPRYTSQTCSKCGNVKESNRVGENYSCSCGYEADADYNAAVNILNRGVYNPSTAEKCIRESV